MVWQLLKSKNANLYKLKICVSKSAGNRSRLYGLLTFHKNLKLLLIPLFKRLYLFIEFY